MQGLAGVSCTDVLLITRSADLLTKPSRRSTLARQLMISGAWAGPRGYLPPGATRKGEPHGGCRALGGAILFTNGTMLPGWVDGMSVAPLSVCVGFLQVLTTTYLIISAKPFVTILTAFMVVVSGAPFVRMREPRTTPRGVTAPRPA